MNPAQHEAEELLHRLASRRALARLVLLFERVWPALWPPLGVTGAFVCLALLDVPRYLPGWLHLALLIAAVVAVVGLLVHGLWRTAAPDDAAADRRLEVASGFRHRPLAVLTDRPAKGDPVSDPLWRAHVLRAIAQIRRVRVGLPRPGLARRDPRALRAGLLLSLIAAAVIAGPDAPSRLAQAVSPNLPRTPINGKVTPFHALDATSFQADLDLTAGGWLAVRHNGEQMAGWDLTVVAPQPPSASWMEPPGPALDGQHVRLPWQVGDEYGVTDLQAELRLRDRPAAPPLVISIPLPGGDPKSAKGISQQDLTAHPWAGLPVSARLIARNAAGLSGESSPSELTLPEREFHNLVARALIAARRGLSVHPEDRDSAQRVLETLLQAPQAFGSDFGAYANLAAIYFLLDADHSSSAIDRAQQRMWQLALHMEEGLTDRTARELAEAQQAANDALARAQKDPSLANREELQKRLKELENALQRHLQALLDQLRRSPDELPVDPNAMMLDARQMERMAEQAQEAARQGRMDDAQQEMAELNKMLDAMRNARTATAQDARRAQQRERGRQQMSVVQDMIARQGGLLDHAQARVQPPDGFDGLSRPPTAATDPQAAQEADRQVQQALRRALGELMQRFTDLTGKLPPSLGEADTDMRSAAEALAQGRDRPASQAEQQAIEALQKGGREMGQTMAQQFGRGEGGQNGQQQAGEGDDEGMLGLGSPDGQDGWNGRGNGQDGPYQPDARRDPFGRRYGQGSSGVDESNSVTVPEQREKMRTQEVEQELRRRGADRTRPQYELDYIGRLLQQF
jgi:hypothetical protein